MKRRIVVIEPDATIRRMMDFALSAGGFAPTTTSTIESCRPLLDAGPIDLAIVEVRATNAEGADGVQALRADYPELPLVVTGTLLTPRLLQALIRARVDDVLEKPFSPRELLASVARALHGAPRRVDGALEYAAAMATARRAIVEGRPCDAEVALARAHAAAPLDAEVMALSALVREIQGADEAADRAYRAALALRQEHVSEDALPGEGLTRLRAYAGARAVPSFDHQGRHTLWLVGDPLTELALGPPGGAKPDCTVFALGLVAAETGAVYARLGRDKRAFLLATSALSEKLALRLARSFEGTRFLGQPSTLRRIGNAAAIARPTSDPEDRVSRGLS